MKYLDPKADVPFKKIFGVHKNLAISFLNALHAYNNYLFVKQRENEYVNVRIFTNILRFFGAPFTTRNVA